MADLLKRLCRSAALILAAGCFLFSLSACGRKAGAVPPDLGEGEAEHEQDPIGKEEDNMTDTIILTIGTHKISVKLEANSAAQALLGLLREGEIVYTASDYGGFEKVGALGHALPRSDRQMTTSAGDMVLYSGDQIVLFYGSNSWSYTKLGTMQGLSAAELRAILTESNPVTVTIGLS